MVNNSDKARILKEEFLEISRERPEDCLQCGKCSASCQAAKEMDFMPHQLVRMFHKNQIDQVMETDAIWACASCFTCGARCPRDIDLARMMETARVLYLRSNHKNLIDENEIAALNKKGLPPQAIVAGYRKFAK
ncbi:4Fe-4S dicluster domain-containing protein [Halanaerobiaceae bacterium Z-7014]|uniref:4Fe-4S dicluster domain-containing protein n=1 Tax=Halonatronomonas betaini TaxID=2778430 RepID=A0A931AR25_9FIRM|nr:4Fe-4S dicluster domain-containing protein [Halonatronomonas betaini]MBF8436937.1 4Fe-4S dicluster domain-containing protein [Halonatronomonas betaini]